MAISSSTEDYRETLIRESHFPPMCSTCSICIAPLISDDEDKNINDGYYNETEFPNCTKISECFNAEGKTLLKILDIKPKSGYGSGNENNGGNEDVLMPQRFPVCKPCYIEIVKYEKLQVEVQRIADQIVSTVLENLEFNSGMMRMEGRDGDINVDETEIPDQNAMESLRELIFKRWKPQENDKPDHTTNDNCSYLEPNAISSSVLKAIAEALNVQPHQLVTGPVVGNETNSSITVELVSSSDSDTFRIPSSSTVKEVNMISHAHEMPSGTFFDTQKLNKIQRPIRCGSDLLNLEMPCSSNNISLKSTYVEETISGNIISNDKSDYEAENQQRNMNDSLQNCKNCSDSLENIECESLDPEQNISKDGMSVSPLLANDTKKCPFCDKLFAFSQAVLEHLHSAHPYETTVLQCETCQQYINSAEKDHNCHETSKLRPDRKGPFICNQCKKEFRQQRDLDVHVRRNHTGERPYVCEVCGKSYPAQSALQHHRKVHSQRFVCDICGIAIVTETGLKKHMQIHEGTKDFQCEICPRKFMWKQSLMKHQAIHSGDKPFSCNFCFRTFPVKNYLDKHINRRHPEAQRDQTEILNCPYCTKAKFRTPGNLSAHILRKHSSASASFV